MCRFIVYKGVEPIQLSHLVTRPKHSITNQAFESKLRFPSSRPMNADGFGIGWYDPQPPPPVATVVPQSTTADHFDQTSNPTAPSTRNDTSGDGEDSPADGTERIKTKDGKPLKGANGSTKPNGLQTRSPSTSRGDSNAPSRTNSPSAADGAGPTIGAENIVPGRDDQEAKEILRKREIERELENERPCMFKSLSPAWSSANLERLAEKIRSPLVFAHVRASTLPGAPSEDNCHPWSFGKLMWMHNGELCGFTKIKRKLQASLPEELFLYPSGYTDSEWAFMVFLSKLKDPHARSFTHLELRNAMMETLKYINELLKEAGVTEPSLLNYVVTDGETVIATRYISSKTSEASSLFFSSGTSFDEYQEGGHYRMTKADKRENIIMIASEPLTFERSDWMEVKTNTMIVITPKMNVLQIPIIDDYWVPPKDPAASARSRDFAISLGFGHGFAASEQEANA